MGPVVHGDITLSINTNTMRIENTSLSPIYSAPNLGWACKKPKTLKIIDSANRLSGCFDRRRCN